ncbi:hypothetical protein J6590_098921, partial [Homalodisca vitripennis]
EGGVHKHIVIKLQIYPAVAISNSSQEKSVGKWRFRQAKIYSSDPVDLLLDEGTEKSLLGNPPNAKRLNNLRLLRLRSSYLQVQINTLEGNGS